MSDVKESTKDDQESISNLLQKRIKKRGEVDGLIHELKEVEYKIRIH